MSILTSKGARNTLVFLVFFVIVLVRVQGQQFVLGSGGSFPLMTSLDGMSYSGVVGSALLMSQVLGVQYSVIQQRFCAVGAGTSTIAYSNDRGVTWVGLGTTVFDTQGVELAYNPSMNRYVAAGSGTLNTLAFSDDCVNFVGLGKTIFDSEGQGVAFSATQIRFVAVGGASNVIAWSSDGIQWKSSVSQSSALFLSASGVAYGHGVGWVAVGTPALSTTTAIAFSLDGTTWTPQTQTAFTGIGGAGRAVTYANGKFLATGSGNGGTMSSSSDGKTWVTINPAVAAIGENGHGSAYSPVLGMWVSTCSDFAAANTVGYSKDNGATWTGLGNIGGGAYCVAAFNNPPLYLSTNVASAQLLQSTVILANASVTVSGRLTVNADLVVHGNWSLGIAAQVNASGMLIVNAGITQIVAGATMSSNVLIVNPSTELQINVPQSAILPDATSVVIPLAYYSELHGSFASVSVNVVGLSSSTLSYTIDYTTSSATLTIVLPTAANASLPSGLSGGAIVGIAIGSVAVASLVVIGVVLVSKHIAKATDAKVNSAIRRDDVAGGS